MVQAHALDMVTQRVHLTAAEVQAKLRGARVVLVVLSPDYCGSWWCVVPGSQLRGQQSAGQALRPVVTA